MVVEIDMEPLATASARALDSDRDELSPDSLSPCIDRHDRVRDERMYTAVPGHVDEPARSSSLRAQTQPRLCLRTWLFQSSSRGRW